jgi:hypothetical protein
MVFLHINKGNDMNLQEKYTASIDNLSSSVRQWLKIAYINRTTKDDNTNRSNIYFTVGDNTRVECTFTVKKTHQDIEPIGFLAKGVNVYYETNDEKIVKILYDVFQQEYDKQREKDSVENKIKQIEKFNTFLTNQIRQKGK